MGENITICKIKSSYIKHTKNRYKSLRKCLTTIKKSGSDILAGSAKENQSVQQTCIKVLNLICNEEDEN